MNYVLNLDRRTDRLCTATAELEREGVVWQRWAAPDGRTLKVEPGYTAGSGAYGCKLGHVQMLEDAIAKGHEQVTIFEDDLILVNEYRAKREAFMYALPNDWQVFFEGGQHQSPAVAVNEHVIKATNCHRTHAYTVRGEHIRVLLEMFKACKGHIDHCWGQWQQKNKHVNVYCPSEWFVGQGASLSDINGRLGKDRWWRPMNVQGSSRYRRTRSTSPANTIQQSTRTTPNAIPSFREQQRDRPPCNCGGK